MRNRGYKIPQPQVPVFLQACAAVIVMWVLYYAASWIVRGLIQVAGMLFVLVVILSTTAAEARHHHRGYAARHAAIPLPRPRPVTDATAPTWTVPPRTIVEQLAALGIWRLQTDEFYREVRR
jgi:hypothetical protein